MGELKVNDSIIDPDGGWSHVTGIFPQGRKPVYEIELSDGSVTHCSYDHLWLVQNLNDKRWNKERVLSAYDLKQRLSKAKKWEKWYVPVACPTYFESETKLPIHPYLLGSLLGNGYFGLRTIRISSQEKHIINRIRRVMPYGVKLHHRKFGDYEICSKRGLPNTLLERTRVLGLSGVLAATKFIPDVYLGASVPNRILLLQGLCDTDGTVSKLGSLTFSSVSKRLVYGVMELVRSLGGVSSIHSRVTHYSYKGQRRKGQRSYTVSLRLNDRESLVSLPRKQDRISSPGHVSRYIKSIRDAGEEECQCISTSSKRGLYITDDFVVTHNTWLSLTCFAESQLNESFSDYKLILDEPEGGALMDIENYFGRAVADKMQRVESESIEDFYHRLHDLIEEGDPFIYVLDSQDALDSKAANKKFAKQKAAALEGQDAKGSFGDGKAKYHSENIRWVISGLKRTKSILIIIGQTRDNLGFGFDKKTRSGGRALKFYASLEAWTSVGKKIKKTVRGKKRSIGVYCIVTVKKNRITGKDRTVVIPIYPSFGIDDVGCNIDFLTAEKYWAKKKGAGVPHIIASDLKFRGTRSELISYVEKGGHEAKLQEAVRIAWKSIEEECKLANRKKRYE